MREPAYHSDWTVTRKTGAMAKEATEDKQNLEAGCKVSCKKCIIHGEKTALSIDKSHKRSESICSEKGPYWPYLVYIKSLQCILRRIGRW